jgi:hypothetical protein
VRAKCCLIVLGAVLLSSCAMMGRLRPFLYTPHAAPNEWLDAKVRVHTDNTPLLELLERSAAFRDGDYEASPEAGTTEVTLKAEGISRRKALRRVANKYRLDMRWLYSEGRPRAIEIWARPRPFLYTTFTPWNEWLETKVSVHAEGMPLLDLLTRTPAFKDGSFGGPAGIAGMKITFHADDITRREALRRIAKRYDLNVAWAYGEGVPNPIHIRGIPITLESPPIIPGIAPSKPKAEEDSTR